MVATAAGFEIVPTGAPGRLLQALHARLVKAAKPASRAASRATSRATSRAASRCGDEVPPSVATHLGVEAAVHPVTSGAGGGPGVVAAATGAAGVQESLLAQAEAWRAMVHPDGAPVGSDPMMGHIPFPGSMAFDVAAMAAANTADATFSGLCLHPRCRPRLMRHRRPLPPLRTLGVLGVGDRVWLLTGLRRHTAR